MMSAALLVVAGARREPWATPLVDLRVDSAVEPLRELRRLVDASEAFDRFSRANAVLTIGGDAHVALREVDDALAAVPGESNMRFLRARALLAVGDVEGGRAELRALIASRPSWEVIVRGFAARGRLSIPESSSLDALLQ